MRLAELSNILNTADSISEEVLDSFRDLDVKGSFQTQAELNKLLLVLYNRLGKEQLYNENYKKMWTQADLVNWVDDNCDRYTTAMFNDTVNRKLGYY